MGLDRGGRSARGEREQGRCQNDEDDRHDCPAVGAGRSAVAGATGRGCENAPYLRHLSPSVPPWLRIRPLPLAGPWLSAAAVPFSPPDPSGGASLSLGSFTFFQER